MNKFISKLFQNHWFLLFITFLILITLLPLSSKINFMQNDDWYYYAQVTKFLGSDYVLAPKIAPTFYLQGFFGVLFTFIFPISKLPILTLLFSIANFFTFSLLLKKHFLKSSYYSVLFALMFFLHPINIYSIWGFMTETFFLFFMLLGILFFLDEKPLVITNLTVLLGFLIKQISISFYLVSSVYFLIKKEIRKSLQQLYWFIGVLVFYEFVFPKTSEMVSKGIEVANLLNFDYSFSLTYGSLIYGVAFTLPLVLFILAKFLFSNIKNYSKLILFFCLVSICYFGANYLFKPEIISWGEFPYFENTFERTGFLPRDIHGTKYQFKGIFDFYYYLDLISKLSLAGFMSFLLLKSKQLVEDKKLLFSIFVVVFLGINVVTEIFYDRYLLVLAVVFLLFVLSFIKDIKLASIVVFPYVVVLGFLAYTFSMDFVLVESYVWGKSQQLSEIVSKDQILATHAWNKNFGRSINAQYLFSYDSLDINPELKDNYKLEETYIPRYPLNIHISPEVFLYKSTKNIN